MQCFVLGVTILTLLWPEVIAVLTSTMNSIMKDVKLTSSPGFLIDSRKAAQGRYPDVPLLMAVGHG